MSEGRREERRQERRQKRRRGEKIKKEKNSGENKLMFIEAYQ